MSNFWNQINLSPPPYSTCKTRITHSELNRLASTLNGLCQFLTTNNHQINIEATILSRVIYRMKHKYRFEKGFKCMQKTNRALRGYLNCSVDEALNSFFDMIDFNLDNSTTYLPTRQSLDYVLVRLLSFAKLLCRIVNSCDLTIDYFQKRMTDGFWTIGLLSISICSRISAIVKLMTDQICVGYDTLYSFYSILQVRGVDWLPSEFSLPSSLKEWLSDSWLYNKPIDSVKLDNSDKVKKIDLSINNFANIQCIDFIFKNQQMNTTSKPNDYLPNNNVLNKFNIDMGISIARDSISFVNEHPDTVNKLAVEEPISTLKKKKDRINVECTTKENKVKEKYKHCIKSIESLADLEKFIEMERSYRDKNVKKCLTKKFDLLQWNIFQKMLLKYVKKLKKAQTQNANDVSVMIISKAKKAIKLSLNS